MLRLKVKNRKALLWIIFALILVFSMSLGTILHIGNQAIAKQQADSKTKLAIMDRKISQIKAKKAAEKKAKEEADKKAAAQKAASDAALSSQLQGKIVAPAGCASSGAHSDPSSIDVVINKKHCFSPIDYAPSDLASYGGYIVSAKIIPDLTAMFNAASSAGVPLSVTSSYRSYANQVTTYNNWVAVNGSTASADTVSARPGYSEHQTGFVMDLSAGGCSLECFAGSAQYRWLQVNGATYGFIERYPQGLTDITGYSPEAWHWRYVGVTTALDMKAKGIKTLEQLWNINGGGY
ncbi:MAG: M15 family metallopeptidase [Candidatus Saccharimonadales bacterium]